MDPGFSFTQMRHYGKSWVGSLRCTKRGIHLQKRETERGYRTIGISIR